MQKVLDALTTLKERFNPLDSSSQLIDNVLSFLTSDDLFHANLGEVNDQDGKEIDKDTKNWIESSLLMTKTGNLVSDKLNSVPKTLDKLKSVNKWSQSSKKNKIAIDEMLRLSCSPTFDCFGLNQITDGQPLCFLSIHILKKFHLNEIFNLNEKQWTIFLVRLNLHIIIYPIITVFMQQMYYKL